MDLWGDGVPAEFSARDGVGRALVLSGADPVSGVSTSVARSRQLPCAGVCLRRRRFAAARGDPAPARFFAATRDDRRAFLRRRLLDAEVLVLLARLHRLSDA